MSFYPRDRRINSLEDFLHISGDKFEPRYIGPFEISRKISDNAYELKLPPSMHIHPVIHVRYLLPYKERTKFPIKIFQPPPVNIDSTDDPIWKVHNIIGKRLRKYGKSYRAEYLVQWSGYSREFDSWEPREQLVDCEELLNKFNHDFDRDEPQASDLEPPVKIAKLGKQPRVQKYKSLNTDFLYLDANYVI